MNLLSAKVKVVDVRVPLSPKFFGAFRVIQDKATS
jgi:hypothetical protein